LKLASLDVALAPAERFGSLVVPPEEGFNGLAQLIFGLEAAFVERLVLQQAEHDLNLVQPTAEVGVKWNCTRPSNFRSQSSFLFCGWSSCRG
jgi:hypothetical protein